jgi:hypothetical protein
MSAGDTTKLGTPLRDGAVNPEAGDFLGPTNAGSQDPHGPLCVNPEIHGSEGIHPVVSGVVSDDPDVQETAELAGLAAFQS